MTHINHRAAPRGQTKIAVSMGDPLGIGPEVIAKAVSNDSLPPLASPIIVGSKPILERAIEITGGQVRLVDLDSPADPIPEGSIGVLDGFRGKDLLKLPVGTPSSQAGAASVFWAQSAALLAMDGFVDAVVTGPINKFSCSLAGLKDIGHMELFQSMTSSTNVATMLLTPGLRVVHLTTHKSLRRACDYVTKDNVLAKLQMTAAFCATHGIDNPRIGVAGLNPHGGDNGLIGKEEIDEIAPAVQLAQSSGIMATGPVPADTIFTQAINRVYDVVLAMYHDQGHIAVKVHNWEHSVTVNLGLPFLRTSVDHGTAFDIAGQGKADSTSMRSAIAAAITMSNGGPFPGC